MREYNKKCVGMAVKIGMSKPFYEYKKLNISSDFEVESISKEEIPIFLTLE